MAWSDAVSRLDNATISRFGTSAFFGSTCITGILDNEYLVSGSDLGVESTSPAFTCKTSDVSCVSHGDTLNIGTDEYTVRGVQPDGTGMTVLILEAADG